MISICLRVVLFGHAGDVIEGGSDCTVVAIFYNGIQASRNACFRLEAIRSSASLSFSIEISSVIQELK